MNYIAIEEFCQHHGVEVRLIQEFADFGLVQLHTTQNRQVVPASEVRQLERMLRLALDLDLNPEGIDVLLNMRQELQRLRRKTQRLQNRLRLLEQERNWNLLEGPQSQGYIIDVSE
ncbi:MAG: chaperone modulator CbpM [Bacteroidota bacterium]|nr:chaperone modulator CbpM [Bacteroidota bacterium]